MLQCNHLLSVVPTSRALLFKSSCWTLNCSSCCSALTIASCRSCSFSVKYWTYCLACCTAHHMFCQHHSSSLGTLPNTYQQAISDMHLASVAYAMHSQFCVRKGSMSVPCVEPYSILGMKRETNPCGQSITTSVMHPQQCLQGRISQKLPAVIPAFFP